MRLIHREHAGDVPSQLLAGNIVRGDDDAGKVLASPAGGFAGWSGQARAPCAASPPPLPAPESSPGPAAPAPASPRAGCKRTAGSCPGAGGRCWRGCCGSYRGYSTRSRVKSSLPREKRSSPRVSGDYACGMLERAADDPPSPRRSHPRTAPRVADLLGAGMRFFTEARVPPGGGRRAPAAGTGGRSRRPARTPPAS